ncbi:glycosyltransferase family 2 protein [Candidatus Uhrbacteria bacterium]|nr:glycosyltransferase family 2 protein [Candidatus Uhrbacteria bacterium]
MGMKAIAVMPAMNEAGRIGPAITGAFKHVQNVIVVDDGSKDVTVEEAKKAGAIVLRHSLNRGQGAALKTGTQAALMLGADVIVHIDADGQHDPDMIPHMLAPITEGKSDVVFGSRFLGVSSEGMPFARRLLLGAAMVFNRLILGISKHITDPQSGLRAMTADAARKIDFKQDRMAHCSEILRLVSRSDLRWMEVPVRIRYTADTLAKGQKPADAFKILWQLLLGSFQ